METSREQRTTYNDRLMFYELCVRRSRWYGAALAAAIAYSVGGAVKHETALAVIIVGIVVAGVTLGMQLFMYENEVLKIQRIKARIGLEQPLDPKTSPASFWATFCRSLTWQFISLIAIVAAGDRITYTLVQNSLLKSQDIALFAQVMVGGFVASLVFFSLISSKLEVKQLNNPDEAGKRWWGQSKEIIMTITIVLMFILIIAVAVMRCF